jgi:hypothetical protein
MYRERSIGRFAFATLMAALLFPYSETKFDENEPQLLGDLIG